MLFNAIEKLFYSIFSIYFVYRSEKIMSVNDQHFHQKITKSYKLF
jgi:hypothetical protein